MALPGPLVTADWLQGNRAEVRIVDVRWDIATGPKIEEYRAGHIPGAVFADLDADLSDPPGERGRHPLPSAERFAATRRRLGLHGPVVAYDDRSGSVAARLWWMLDAIGVEVAVLDGGLAAWTSELESGERSSPLGATPAAVPWPTARFIDADALLPAIAAGAVLLDARSAERFGGQPNPIDDRPGHVPGSVSRPWTDNVAASGLLLPADRLAAELAELGVDSTTDLIASCGSGVTGCHDLLAARVAGLDGGRLYVGSWSEWSRDPDRPVARSVE